MLKLLTEISRINTLMEIRDDITIEKISDMSEILNHDVIGYVTSSFRDLYSADYMVKLLTYRKPGNESIMVKHNGKIIGVYLFNDNQIPTNFTVNNVKIDFLENPETLEIYNKLKKLKGVEGMLLSIAPEYKNMGIGKKLIEYSRNNLSADYIWGMQDKRFNNLNDWLKRRKLYYTGEFFYITYEIL